VNLHQLRMLNCGNACAQEIGMSKCSKYSIVFHKLNAISLLYLRQATRLPGRGIMSRLVRLFVRPFVCYKLWIRYFENE